MFEAHLARVSVSWEQKLIISYTVAYSSVTKTKPHIWGKILLVEHKNCPTSSQIFDSGETKREIVLRFCKPKEGCLDMLLPFFHSYLTEIVRFWDIDFLLESGIFRQFWSFFWHFRQKSENLSRQKLFQSRLISSSCIGIYIYTYTYVNTYVCMCTCVYMYALHT